MDLREKKTLRSIRNSFLTLRKGKPLEKISVKELAELAEISKGTFYLHYKDIFDLSDSLQNEVIQSILEDIRHPEYFLTDPAQFTREMVNCFSSQQQLIEILFQGNQSAVLPMRIEQEMRSFLHKKFPKAGEKMDMMLTYQILGSFYVIQQYECEDDAMAFVMHMAQTLSKDNSEWSTCYV